MRCGKIAVFLLMALLLHAFTTPAYALCANLDSNWDAGFDSDSGAGSDADAAADTGLDADSDTDSDADADNTVTTLDELLNWLSQNGQDGGCVYVDNNIYISDKSIELEPLSPVIIDTGRFGFVINNAYFTLNHNIEIRGEGIENPLILSENSNLTFDNGTRIISAGRNGQGGVAISGSDDLYIDVFELSTLPCLIRAEGNEAVAIQAAGFVFLEYLSIEATGANSIAVYSETSIEAYMCHITALGEKASVAVSPNSILDTCITLPQAENAVVYKRYIAGWAGGPCSIIIWRWTKA